MLIATPGAVNANSYCTVLTASVLLTERLGTQSWLNASTLEKEQSLLWATQLLDQYAQWIPERASTTQALWWPCTGAYDAYGVAIPSTIIPLFLERAASYYAFLLLTAEPYGQQERPSRVKIGTVEFEHDGQTPVHPADALPSAVHRLLSGQAMPIGGGMSRVVRV